MAASFPTTVKVFTSKVDLVDLVVGSDVNTAYDEITAIENSLGLGMLTSSWSGGFAQTASWATLKARLDNIEHGILGDVHSQYFKNTGGTISGSVTITGTLQVNSNGSISGTLYAAGLATFAGGVSVTGGNASVTNNLSVGGTITGNVSGSISGGNVSGGTVTGNQVNSNGNANIAGALGVGGLATVGGLQNNGNETVNGSFNVYGGSYIHNSASFYAGVAFGSDVNFNGANLYLNNLTGAPGGYTYVYLQRRTSDDRVFTGATVGSSRVLKRDIKPVSASSIFDAVQPVTFRYKKKFASPSEAARLRFGFIAEQLESVGLSNVVDYDPDGHPIDVDTRQLLALLWAEVQTLKADVAALQQV